VETKGPYFDGLIGIYDAALCNRNPINKCAVGTATIFQVKVVFSINQGNDRMFPGNGRVFEVYICFFVPSDDGLISAWKNGSVPVFRSKKRCDQVHFFPSWGDRMKPVPRKWILLLDRDERPDFFQHFHPDTLYLGETFHRRE
jgi:hypothetical protein